MPLRHRVVVGVGRPGLDPNGNRIRVTHPDEVYFSYSYDGLDRMTGISENGTTEVASVTYDAQGRRSGATRAGVSTAYSYDPVSRLASLADDLVGTANDVASSFAWNPASQMIRKVRDNDGYGFTASVDVDRDYGVNGLNQYVSAGPAAFSYDANGNLTSDGATTYGYDVENRLVTASGASAVTMVWDPKGRLYQTGGGGFGATQYLYDGDELLVEYTTTGTIRRRYVHGPGDDDPMIWYEGATLTDQRSLQTDHQGSVVSIADASGALVAINAYDEYGIPQNSLTGATEPQGRFAYTGQAWIPELGMYHYKARIYSPTLGRFLQTDPIGYEDQFNLYAYVGSDPVNGRDPGGLTAIRCDGVESPKGIKFECRASDDGKKDTTISFYTNGVKSHADVVIKGDALREGRSAADASRAIGAVTKLSNLIGNPIAEANSRSKYKTESEARSAASENGWNETNYHTAANAKIYYDPTTKTYWTRDTTSHSGGAWKRAESPEKFNSQLSRDRLGTYDRSLRRIAP